MHERDKITIVDAYSMDTQLPESPKELGIRYRVLKDLQALGYNFREVMLAARQKEDGVWESMYEMAALLHSDWQVADRHKNETHAVTVAKLFNALTYQARELRPTLSTKSNSALATLSQGIHENYTMEADSGEFNQEDIAKKLFVAAHQLTQRDTWAYRLLPSRYGQAYTSMGLFSVAGDAAGLPPTYVTNITVRNTRGFSHMHGLSASFSAPNGNPSDFANNNEQVNIIWRLNDSVNGFPPRHVSHARYDATNVVSIPPGYLHSIVRPNNQELFTAYSLHYLVKDPALVQEVVKNAKFGLYTNTHVYRPTREMLQRFENSPLSGLWQRAGTIALDHENKSIYAGNLHAMALRMAYWRRGECCGACFTGHNARKVYQEDDTRELLSVAQVRDLIYTPQPAQKIPIWKGNPYTGKLL